MTTTRWGTPSRRRQSPCWIKGSEYHPKTGFCRSSLPQSGCIRSLRRPRSLVHSIGRYLRLHRPSEHEGLDLRCLGAHPVLANGLLRAIRGLRKIDVPESSHIFGVKDYFIDRSTYHRCRGKNKGHQREFTAPKRICYRTWRHSNKIESSPRLGDFFYPHGRYRRRRFEFLGRRKRPTGRYHKQMFYL